MMKKLIAPVCVSGVRPSHLGVWRLSKEDCIFRPCEEPAKSAAEVAKPAEPDKKAEAAKRAEAKLAETTPEKKSLISTISFENDERGQIPLPYDGIPSGDMGLSNQ